MKYTPSQELLAARRTLESLSFAKLLHDWVWNEEVRRWVLHCRIDIDVQPGSIISKSTDWYVLVEPQYPWGEIGFYPAKENGLTHTFPHQSFNGYGSDKVPWRDGKICLSTSVNALSRNGYDIEPNDVYWRLHWHFERAVQWLIAASFDKLTSPGDPFELPHFPLSSLATVAFCEGSESFAQWQNASEQAGIVNLIALRKKPDLYFVKSFRSIRGKEIFSPTWGRAMTNLKDEGILGIWVCLKNMPVFKPWQVPSTWEELREICREQEIKLDELLRATAHFIRDRKKHIALIGFPIPAIVDTFPCQMSTLR